jgi:hypothetical protein
MKCSKRLALSVLLLAPCLAHALEVKPSDFDAKKPEGAYEVVAPRTAQPPVIDGDLGDPAWDKAGAVGSFWQAGSADLAKDQTRVWVCFDADNLYLAWACLDKKVASDPAERDDKSIWRQDGVELFLSPERDGSTERQLVLNAAGSVFDRRPGKEYGEGGRGWNPKWDGKVKRQPWGYTAEMCVPLAELTDVKKYPVVRGTVWKMKLVREDRGDEPGLKTSSWTPIGRSTGDQRAGGKLIFEDRNLLANGGAETVDANGALPGWFVEATKCNVTLASSTQEKTEGARSAAITVKGRKVEGAQARVKLGAVSIPPAAVETTYAFTADVKAVCPDDTLLAYLVAYQGGKAEQLNFTHNEGWQKVRTVITAEAGSTVNLPVLQTGPVSSMSTKQEGGGMVYIDNVRLEIIDLADAGLDPDSVCLTGNAVDAYRTRNHAIAGTYTYTEAMMLDPSFPYYFPPGAEAGVPQDFGLYRGEIPFDKGRLTDGHASTSVNWPAFWSGHQGRDFTFDLKKEYVITRVVVKVTYPGLRFTHLFLKSPGEPIYTLVASEPDKVKFKTSIEHGETMLRVDQREIVNINQPSRWVRIQAEARAPAQFCEIEIWGKELGQPGAKPKRIPYLQAGGATPIKNPASQPEPAREVPPVYPMPKEMQLSGGPIALPDGLLIQYEPAGSARAKTTAEVLRDELKLCYGIGSTVAPASAEQAGAILIGEATNSPITAAALKKHDQSVTTASPGPQGYVLVAKDKRIVIGGSDACGAFYGVQALLTLARVKAAGQWEVPGIVLRDWPDMKMRIIEGRATPTEALVRALARFRVNYYTPRYVDIASAAELDAFSERYFVSFIPCLDVNQLVIDKDPTLTERPATERWEDVPRNPRRNANPGHPRTWEIYFAEVDKWLPKFHGDILYIGMDETYQYEAGSRWNVSPESLAMKMSAGPLLAYMLNKIDQKAKQYGKRVFMHDTPFCRDFKLSHPGDPDPSWRKALPLLPKDIMFNVWHWNKQWVLEPLGKEYGFDLVYLCTGDRDWRAPAKIDPNDDMVPFEFPGYFAGINNYMNEGSFTASKLLETVWVGWNTKAVRPKDPAANAATARYVQLWNQLHLGEALSPSLQAQKRDFQPIDISAAANRSRIDEVAGDGQGWVDLGPNVDLRALEAGTVEMSGIPFRIINEKRNKGRSVVMVQNAMYTDRTMPDTAEIDLKGLKAASLVFLHAIDNAPGWNYLRRKELAGFYFIVFEDGTYAKCEIKYGVNSGTWDGQHYGWEYAPAGDTMPYGKLAWQGQTMSGMNAKLYMTEWANPRPELKIAKIILRATYDPVPMNPMLLAVTAVDSRLAAKRAEKELPSASLLQPPKPEGVLVDLSGGKDESELRYVAPDGTVIEAAMLHNGLSDNLANAFLVNDWRSYVGLVTLDGHQAARTDKLVFTFPKPVPLTGVLVAARFREQRKSQNFAPMVYDIFVDVSGDGGKTWQEKGVVRATSAEELGPVWIPLGEEAVMVRLRQTQCPGTPDYFGFSAVKFYRKP